MILAMMTIPTTEEVCDLNPEKVCRYKTALVPRLIPQEECTQAGDDEDGEGDAGDDEGVDGDSGDEGEDDDKC